MGLPVEKITGEKTATPFLMGGQKISDLEDLAKAIASSSQQDFQAHKQEIISWIRDALNDIALFRRVRNLAFKENFSKQLNRRILELGSYADNTDKRIIDVSLDMYVNSVKLTLDKDKCVRCDVSHTVCPKEAVIVEGDNIDVEKGKCVLCGLCVPFCPTGALEIRVDGKPDNLNYTNKGLPQLPELEEINGIKVRRLFDGAISVSGACPEGCEECVSACPISVIERAGTSINIDKETCILCGACKKACPEDLITLERNRIFSKKGDEYSASWTETLSKFLGDRMVNVERNARSIDRMKSLMEDPDLEGFTK